MPDNIHFIQNDTFQALRKDYNIVDDLFEGTRAVRKHSSYYLPQEPKESNKNYEMRVDRSVLEPVFKRTILQSVGKAFSKPIEVTVPQTLESLKANVDNTGVSIESYSKDLLTETVKYGIMYVLVDFPVTDPNFTLEDEIRAGVKPYFVNIKPADVMDIEISYVNGFATLSRFLFLEYITEYDYMAKKNYSLTQAKEFVLEEDEDGNTLVIYRIYRKDDNGKEFLYDENIIRGVDSIPVVPVYSGKVEPYIGAPPLMDLAHMNILHYRKSSDVDHSLHLGAMPMLEIKGNNSYTDPETGKEEEIVISPNSGINVSETGGVRWIELNGSGIKTYMDNIKELEASMSILGLELTSKKALYETATGRILDEHTSNSLLKSICIDLESSLEKAFRFAASYIGADEESIAVNIDTSLAVSPDSGVDMLVSLVKEGILTAQDALEEIKQRRLLIINPEQAPRNTEGSE